MTFKVDRLGYSSGTLGDIGVSRDVRIVSLASARTILGLVLACVIS